VAWSRSESRELGFRVIVRGRTLYPTRREMRWARIGSALLYDDTGTVPWSTNLAGVHSHMRLEVEPA
jgi:hypothetical protein